MDTPLGLASLGPRLCRLVGLGTGREGRLRGQVAAFISHRHPGELQQQLARAWACAPSPSRVLCSYTCTSARVVVQCRRWESWDLARHSPRCESAGRRAVAPSRRRAVALSCRQPAYRHPLWALFPHASRHPPSALLRCDCFRAVCAGPSSFVAVPLLHHLQRGRRDGGEHSCVFVFALRGRSKIRPCTAHYTLTW